MVVLIVAKCIVNTKKLYIKLTFKEVLIVAKCIVNEGIALGDILKGEY